MEIDTKQPKLFSLYFPAYHRCNDCKIIRVASAVQILNNLSDRRLFFCKACAKLKEMPQRAHSGKVLAGERQE